MDNFSLYEQKRELLLNCSIDQQQFCVNKLFILHGLIIQVWGKNISVLSHITKWVKPIEFGNIDITIYLEHSVDMGIADAVWDDEDSQDCFHLEKKERAVIHRDFIAQELQPSLFWSVVSLSSSDGVYNLLRWLLPPFLLAQKKAILHSSAVLNRANEAFMFLGYSGHGKTTITSLAEDRNILGDDMNLVSNDDLVTASPGGVGGAFIPTVAIESCYPVKAFFWLVQSKSDQIIPVKAAKSAQYLMSSFVGWNWQELNISVQQEMMTWVNSIVSKVPFYTLEFRKDRSVWNLLEEM